jgi:hypothetical protein
VDVLDGEKGIPSGRGGGRPTAREGEDGWRDKVRCFFGERDIRWTGRGRFGES